MERGEVRLTQFAEPDKLRPAVILTRPSSIRGLSRVTVAPITSTIRGVGSEVRLDVEDGMKGPCAVNLHNLHTVPKPLIGRRVTTLPPEKMEAICRALAYSLGCGR